MNLPVFSFVVAISFDFSVVWGFFDFCFMIVRMHITFKIEDWFIISYYMLCLDSYRFEILNFYQFFIRGRSRIKSVKDGPSLPFWAFLVEWVDG